MIDSKSPNPKTPKSSAAKGGTIIDKLRSALDSDGDFPVQAKAINDLRNLVSDPLTPIDRVSECILREPSLGARVLHLVNSSFYQRPQPILTVSQAVMQIGMRSLTDLCAGMVLLRHFISPSRRDGAFSENIVRCIMCALVTAEIAKEWSSEDDSLVEQGFLAGTFFAIGPLLLAYYFPQVFEQASKRAAARHLPVTQSLTELIGCTPSELSLGIIDSLAIPEHYREALVSAQDLISGKVNSAPSPLARAIAASLEITDAALSAGELREFERLIENITEKYGITPGRAKATLAELPKSFEQHCQLIELPFLELPQLLLLSCGNTPASLEPAPESNNSDFLEFIAELKRAVRSGDTLLSVVTAALEHLVFVTGYDRGLLFMSNITRDTLEIRMSLGQALPAEAKNYKKHLGEIPLDEETVEVKAFLTGTVQTTGKSPLADGWPYAALPIGLGDRSLGTLYVDRLENEQSVPLDYRDIYALNIIAEILEEARKVH